MGEKVVQGRKTGYGRGPALPREGLKLKSSSERVGNQGQNSESRDAVKTAIETGDYNAFIAALPENAPIKDQITADNFAQFQELHHAREARDYETAQSIANELGLEKKGKKGSGNKGMKGGRR